MQLTIRAERPDDIDAIDRINNAAFGRPEEGRLVDRLRARGVSIVSLVAELDGGIVGHVLFTPVEVESDRTTWNAVALGPMAVAPAFQNLGVGSELVRKGLAACAGLAHPVVFVLGHPGFYPRFGFVPASRFGIGSEYDLPDEIFMVAELEEGAIGGRAGLVHYHPEFAATA